MKHFPRLYRWGTAVLATAAGASIALLPVLAGTAGASVTPPQLTTTNFAGAQASGNGFNYRYVQGTFTLPDITSGTFKAALPGGFGSSVRLQDSAQTVDLGISTTPDSGVFNAAVAVEFPDGTVGFTNGSSPQVQPGDTVRLSLLYNYTGFMVPNEPAGQVDYSAQDLTHPADSFSGHFSDTGQWFSTARVGDGFSADDYAVPNPAVGGVNGNQRLSSVTGVVVTSRTGARGSAGVAPWPVQRLAVVSPGDSTHVLVSTPFFWGKYAASPDTVVRDGHNLGIWMPSYPS